MTNKDEKHPDARMNEPVKGQLSPRRAHHIEIVGMKDTPHMFVIELRDNTDQIFAIAMLPTSFIPKIRTLFDQIEALGATKQ